MADLTVNNERAWFQPRKADFERLLKAPMEQLVIAVGERFQARGIPHLADPKRSPIRINRDTRFSRDQSPYKTARSDLPVVDGPAGGRRRRQPHGNGSCQLPARRDVCRRRMLPEKPRLEAFRRAIVDDPDRVRGALEDPAFVASFGGVRSHEQLKRVPPELPADHPMADMFRWKDLVFGRPLSDDEVCSAELPDRLADGFAAAMPVFRFLATLR
jgi:uncharacterized protein (TIGR02453 family)